MTAPASTTPPPLWAPFYGAPFGAAVKRFFSKYYTFAGRAGRAEYWWVVLFLAIISLVLNIITGIAGGNRFDTNGMMQSPTGAALVVSIIAGLWSLFTLIPTLALLARRLHDSNHSGFWIFIGLVPLVGFIVLLVFVLSSPNPEGARFDKPTS